MSFTYDPTGLATELNRIRLEIGDTVDVGHFLEDEEIAYIQTEFSSFYARVAGCCTAICAQLAKQVKHKLGEFSEDSQQLYDHYKQMAARYASLTAAFAPWAASISVSDKETTEEDTGLVSPKFTKGIHDYGRSQRNDEADN